jgi:hypothetical protein
MSVLSMVTSQLRYLLLPEVTVMGCLWETAVMPIAVSWLLMAREKMGGSC